VDQSGGEFRRGLAVNDDLDAGQFVAQDRHHGGEPVHFVSDAAPLLTGQIISVDGGKSAA
jgi:hypothetical protein